MMAMYADAEIEDLRWRAFLAGFDRAKLEEGEEGVEMMPLERVFARFCEHEDAQRDAAA